MSEKEKTIIIGGGWAGLSAAIELSRHQQPVQVLESAKQLGGRARRVPFDKDTLDNGQHLLIGAYKDTLKLLKTIGLNIDDVLQRHILDWQVYSPHHKKIRVQTYTAPAPFHLLLGLIMAKGLKWREKLSAMSLGHKLWKGASIGENDISVTSWLQQHRQPQRLITAFWEPLCLATLNTPLKEASAKTFVRVLSDAFLHSASASDYLIPRQDLSSTFVDPAMTFIEKNNGHITLAQRVDKVLVENNQVIGVECQGVTLKSDHVIISTPPNITATILNGIPSLNRLSTQLSSFTYQPICTVYLRYPEQTHIPMLPVMGMTETVSQWLFDRRVCQQPGVIAVVISSSGQHMALENDELIKTVTRELQACFPDWPAHITAKVIREKRATFACNVGIDSIRPQTETAVNGLFLAGDHVDTGYPATLEGAVQSGIRAAQAILNSNSKRTL